MEMDIKGLRFIDVRSNPNVIASPEKIPILKDRGFIELYGKLFANIRFECILEFGIAKGGSAILHTVLFEPKKYVGIDIKQPEEDIIKTIQALNLNNIIKLYFNTSQNDEKKIRDIIQTEFPDGIDLIIDDASHLFDLTLKSFEISFPYLKPNGYYIIEDWGWAHWRNFKGYKGLPALSQIAFLLIMMHASFPELIAQVKFVHPALIIVLKGSMKVIPEFFKIRTFININDFSSMTYLNYTFYKDFLVDRVVFLDGHVDVVDSEKIAGWILDTSGGPCRFGIRVNGKIAYEGITNVERKDIKQIYGITHNAGFHVPLQEINIPNDYEEISVEVFHIPSGVIVPGNYQKVKVKKP